MERIKSYYNKDKFEYSHGLVDVFEFHQTFFLFFKWYGVLDTEPPSKLSDFSLVYMVVSTIVSLSYCMMSTCYGIQLRDIPMITEAGTYFIVLFYKLLIIRSARTDAVHFHALQKIMKADFEYICTEGNKYRKKFFENQLLTWQIGIKIIVFINFITVGMIVFASLYLAFYYIVYQEGQNKRRPLLFPFWAPGVDFFASPRYEITFIFSNISVFLYGFNYLFMLLTQVVWIRHVGSKADLVIWGLHDLFKEIKPAINTEEAEYYAQIIKYKFKDIIKQHQSMYTLIEHYTRVYKKNLMYEQLMCGPVICLTAFCAVEKLDAGELNAILILLCVACIVNFFIPSYLCTYLSFKVNSVCDACFESKFWNAGSVVRPYLVLIMQRSLRKLPLKEPGLEDVSLQTFSNKIASAYTWFNMLRQTS